MKVMCGSLAVRYIYPINHKHNIMKTRIFQFTLAFGVAAFFMACSAQEEKPATAGNTAEASSAAATGGQMNVMDEESQPNVVKVAVGSKDHSTLVTAVQKADLVNALSNNGPFTVFAPTNAAFDALPPGTVDDLLKPESKEALADILQYHVYVGVLNKESLQDGQSLGMVNGMNATIHIQDGKTLINDAAIVASVPASNGIVHVIDKVILPPKK